MSLQLLDIILHLDTHLNTLINYVGPEWFYALLSLIIFCESGLFFIPFLPGDSLLFATGSLAATGGLDIGLLALYLSIAAVVGGFVNYGIGYKLGDVLFPEGKPSRYRKYLIQTHEFYERHGGKTILIARFIPIIRTFAPFVAGLAKMNFLHFAIYNVVGGIGWVCLLLFASFYFGSIEIIKHNFSLVVLLIIVVSLLPAIFEVLRQRCLSRKSS